MSGEVKPNELYSLLKEYFAQSPSDTPCIMLWGPPGVGKSSIVKQAARDSFESEGSKEVGDERRYVKDIRLTLSDPTDLRGLPAIKGDTAVWLPPSQLPNTERDLDKGAVFLDELPSAPPAVQVTAHRLVLDRSIEEYELPKGWFVIAAGNRRTDKALVYEMNAPLANRFIHFELTPELDSWKEWALQNGVRSEVISFLNFREDLLVDLKTSKNSMAFPSPRSWEFLSKMLDMQGKDEVADIEVIKSCVGEGAATEFYGFLKTYSKLPDPKEALEKHIVPGEESEQYALNGAITNLYRREPKKYAEKVLQYSYKIQKEFAVVLVRDCVKTKSKITNTKEWVNWSDTFSDVLL